MARQKKKSAAKPKPKATAKRKRKKNPNLLVIAGNPGVSVGSLVHQVGEDGRPGRRVYRVVRVLPAEQPGPGILWAMPARAQLVRDDGRDGGEVPLSNLVPARGKNPGRSGATGSCHACHVDDHAGCHGAACSCWCSGTTRVERALPRRNPGGYPLDDFTMRHLRDWIRTRTYDEDEAEQLEALILAEVMAAEPGEERDYLINLGWPEVARRVGTSWHRKNPGPWDPNDWPPMNAERAAAAEQQKNDLRRLLVEELGLAFAAGRPLLSVSPTMLRDAGVDQYTSPEVGVELVHEQVMNASIPQLTQYVAEARGMPSAHRWKNPPCPRCGAPDAYLSPVTGRMDCQRCDRGRGTCGDCGEHAELHPETGQCRPCLISGLRHGGEDLPPGLKNPKRRRRNPGAGIPRGGRSGSRVVGEATIEEAVRVHGAKKVANAQKRAKKFHGREAERAVVVRVPDGKKKVTKKLVVAMGLVPETVYQVPGEWGSSKGDHVYQHDHPATKPPIKVLDPETNLTMDLPQHPDARITDWMYQ